MKGRQWTEGRIGSSRKRRNTGIGGIRFGKVFHGSLTEAIKGFFWCSVEVEDLPTSNETNRVGSLGGSGGTVKADNLVGKTNELFVEFDTESIELTEIEGSKI